MSIEASMHTQKLPWHPPRIVEHIVIRLSKKKNNWPNFFLTINKIFASHQTFPVVYPKVEIIPTKVWGNRKRVNHHGCRTKVGKQCCDVEYDEDMLRTLTLLKLLPKEKWDDRDAVGEAVAKMWKHVRP
jgi:hypothetical protein